MKVVVKGEFKSSKVNLRNTEEIKLDVYLVKVSEKDLRKVNKNSESRITAEVIIFGEEPKLKSPVF